MHSLLLTFSIVCQQVPDGASADPVSTIVDSLNAGFEKWLADVEFRADYVYRMGVSRSEEAAIRGEIDHAQIWSDGVLFSCRGLYVKTKNDLRVSGDYGAPPMRKATDRVTRVSFDELKSSQLRVIHHPDGVRNPETSTTRGSLITTPDSSSDDSLADRYAAGPAARSQISPLSLWGGEVRLPCIMNVLPEVTVEKRIRKIDDSRLEVTIGYDKSSSRERTVVWRQDFSPAVVESIQEVFDWPAKNVRTINRGFASDFVQCDGGAVPRKVVEVLWDQSHPEQWLVRTWESENLSSQSRVSDLTINVAANTQIGGLKESTSRSKAMQIDFSKVKRDDLPPPKTRIENPPIAPPQPRPTLWITLCNLLLLAVVCAVLPVFRKRDVS